MKKNLLELLVILMIFLAAGEMQVGGWLGTLGQFLWTTVCLLIAFVLFKKMSLTKEEN